MPNSRKEKLYCFVDETGQDTQGQMFLVCVLITKGQAEELRNELELVERESGKGSRKWFKTSDRSRLAYVRNVLHLLKKVPAFYSVHRDTRDYQHLTAVSIEKAIAQYAQDNPYEAVVLIDGLRKQEQRKVGSDLRKRGVEVEKVRGVDESDDALIRLADALAGFIRNGIEKKKQFGKLYQEAREKGLIQELQ